jgi:putative inorganic carbon (HCO3(-)) transporter
VLTALKELLHTLLPYTLYAGLWVLLLRSSARRPHWSFLLLVAFIPTPSLWHLLLEFPLGRKTIDLLFLATLIGIKTRDGQFQRPPAIGLILLVVVVTYIAVWNCSLRFNLPIPLTLDNDVFAAWKNYAEMLLLYFLAYNVARTESSQKTAVAAITATVFLIAFRELRGFSAGSAFSYDKRSVGPFWQVGMGPNHFAAFIAYIGVFLLGLSIMESDKRRRWMYLGTAVACVYPLFFAYSRGAYLGTAVALAVIGVLKSRRVLLALAVLAVTWQAVLPSTVVERITMTETSQGQLEESAAERLPLWNHAKELFADNPVFGIGFDGFAYTVPRGALSDVHNFYLKTAAEQGVIGLLLIAALLVRALYAGWTLYRQGRSGFHRGLGLGFLACTFALGVTNIFGERWSAFALGGYFWLIWGLVDRARLLSKQSDISPAAVTPNEEGARLTPARRVIPARSVSPVKPLGGTRRS